MTRQPYFPRHTGAWPSRLEVSRLRAATFSAALSGAATGVLLRVVRLVVFERDAGPLVYIAAWVVGLSILCGMLTLHLANYPLRRWPLRVAAFWLAEVAAEMVTSALLIAAGLEPRGSSAVAHFHDLPDMAVTTLLWRGAILGLFATVLAGVVQLVRRTLPRHESVQP